MDYTSRQLHYTPRQLHYTPRQLDYTHRQLDYTPRLGLSHVFIRFEMLYRVLGFSDYTKEVSLKG